MSYEYWEAFFREWKKWKTGTKAININGWTNPDPNPNPKNPHCAPLYNSSGSNDLSSNYVPEPWWGNDGTQPLHSVVINFNPGSGSPSQHINSIKKLRISSYRTVVESCHSHETSAWHFKNRAELILTVLKNLGYISDSDVTLLSHLSIELIPWHTKSVSKRINPGYNVYCNQNLKQIFNCSIKFAAEQSRRIENDKLRNKVIIRISEKSRDTINLQDLLNGLKGIGQCSRVIKPRTVCGKGRYMEFKFNNLPDVTFVCIWIQGSNRLPSIPDLTQIVSQI